MTNDIKEHSILGREDVPVEVKNEIRKIIDDSKQVEEELRKRERFFSNILDNMQDGICILDKEFNIIYTNPTMEEWYSHTTPLLGNKCYKTFQERKEPCERCPAHQSLITGQTAYEAVPKRDHNGEIIGWWDLYTFPLIEPSTNKLKGIIAHYRDITGRKHVEEALQETKQRYQTMLEKLHEGVLVEDTEGFITFINPRAAEMLGYTIVEMIGQHSQFVIPPEELDHIKEETAKRPLGVSSTYETYLVAKDGHYVPIHVSATPLFSDIGAFQGVLSVFTDISDHKHAEETLRTSESQYRSTLDSMGDMIHVVDADLRIILANNALRQQNKELSLATEVIGLPLSEIYPFLSNTVFEEYQTVFKTGKMLVTEEQTRIGEKEFLTETRKIPFFEEGVTTRIVTVIRDITERKQAEKELETEKERYQTLVEKMQEGVLLEDSKGVITFANPCVIEKLRYTEEELIGQHWTLIIPEEEFEHVDKETTKRPYGISSTYETALLAKDGTLLPIIVSAIPLFTDKGVFRGVLSVFTDITERKQMENALRASEGKYRQLVELLPQAVFELDLEGNITFTNQYGFDSTGYTQEDLDGGLNVLQLSVTDDKEEINNNLQKILSGERLGGIEYTVLKKDGSTFPVLIYSAPIMRGGKAIGIRGILADITDRKRMEKTLKASESQYRSTIDSMGDMIHVIDKDLRIVLTNTAISKKLSELHLEEDIIGRTIPELFPFLPSKVFEEYQHVFSSKETLVTEEIMNIKDIEFLIESRKIPIQDAKGDVTQIITILRDISERKKGEKALRESEDRYKTLSEVTLEGIVFHDQGIIVDINTTFVKMFGYEREELIGKNGIDLIILPEYRDILREKISIGYNKPYEIKCQRKDDTILPVEIEAREVQYKEKTLRVASVRDITERKKAAEALRQSEEKYRTILEAVEDGYYEVDIAGNFTFFNDSMCRLLGYSEDEMLGMNNRDYMDAENAKKVYEIFNRIYRTGEPKKAFHWKITRNDGTSAFIEASISLIHDSTGQITGFRGVVRDVTERIQTEEALHESEQKFRTLAESSLVGIVILQDFKIKYANEAAAQIMGLPRREIESWSAKDIQKAVHPDDISLVMDQLQKKQTGEIEGVIPHYSLRIVTDKEEIKWIEMYSTTIIFEGKNADFVTVIDITEIKRREEENISLLNELQLANEELEDVNQELRDFAHIVSHDLKAPLRSIGYFGKWLTNNYAKKLDDEAKKRLELFKRRVKRMSTLIDGILQYSQVSRIQEEQTKVDLRKLIIEIIELINPPNHINIAVETEFPVITCEKTRITQVWMNLLDNAVKFIDKPQGEIKISCLGREEYWEFSISDNGPGIEEKYLDQVFKILQPIKTPSEDEGSGIGLALVKRIIEQENGKIWVESKVGKGTKFFFTLPK
ncbi:MAG: PAS domain S-box protein [Promethearchaeota archaeon]